jgi:hypothetical protein
MELKAGSRWRSAVCDTEVVVVRAPTGEQTLECGGHPMIAHDAERPAGGAGSLSLSGQVLALKDAKPLPSSD